MHVAMVTELPTDPTNPGGGVVAVAVCLIRALIRQGIRVTTIAWGNPREEAYDDGYLGCRVLPVRRRRFAVLANALKTSREVRQVVASLQPDVVHVQALPELGLALSGPRVYTMHGVTYRDEWLLGRSRRYVTAPIMALTFWLARRKFRHVIMISPYSHRIGGGHRDVCLYDIPNPIDDVFFSVRRVAFTPTVLVVASLSELKNTMGVVRTAAKIREAIPDVRFRIAGSWRKRHRKYRSAVEALCRQEGLKQTVQFLGHLARSEIVTEISQAACLFLPSFQENAPMVISEAMAGGVPVAASRVGGIPWMVDDGETGYLFDPNHVDQMVEALARLLRDPEGCERMGRTARQVAENRYRADIVARQTIAVYERAIVEHPG